MSDKLEQAAQILPPHLRRAALGLTGPARTQAEEIRLRMGVPLSVRYGGDRERVLHTTAPVTAHDFEVLMENATRGSLHTALESIRGGFITIEGGHRLGVCGRALVRDGKMVNMRDISSVCVRIARERPGVAAALLPGLIENGRLHNTLILSPPGLGKTTLLRDMIRGLSSGETGEIFRVSVADERGELCGCVAGQPQMDVGPRTDVWTGLAKAEAAVMLLRGLSPEVLALDEITAPEDIRAVEMCVGCGVSVLATAHAAGAADLLARPVYRALPALFTRYIVIETENGQRKYHVQGGLGV